MEGGVDPDRLAERIRAQDGRSVIRREHHYGVETFTIAATADDFRDLAERIHCIAEAGEGNTHLGCTSEESPSSETYLLFEVVTESELRNREKGTLKGRAGDLIGVLAGKIGCPLILIFSLTGFVTLVSLLVALVLRLIEA